jgi:xylulokinase
MKQKVLLGYDIGSSSIKAALLNGDTGELMAAGMSPAGEMKIDSSRIGWAEQDPDTWWQHVVLATRIIADQVEISTCEIMGIGISYQMHGLVIVDREYKPLRPSIIWCDSRAVEIGNKAFRELGSEYCLGNCLNSPGNFTAAKLKWVKENQPELYRKIYKFMLPGEYVALKMTGKIFSTVSGLSEAIIWDFKEKKLADRVIDHFGIDRKLIPETAATFSVQGNLTPGAASELGLAAGIPVAYRAGDQPNNALSLNVLNPGEVAATAGTSGVIYGVTNKPLFDEKSRVNPFAHVNYSRQQPNVGILLCINGTGILYSWLKQTILENRYTYDELNQIAAATDTGAQGLFCYPYGNGAERSLENKEIQAHFSGINFNMHAKGHLIRAAQEGIVYSFRYGLDIMKAMGMDVNIVRAGATNLFQSELFREAFVNTCEVDLELYNTDGAQGAARGAGLGAGYYNTPDEAFKGLKRIGKMSPDRKLSSRYNEIYQHWKVNLEEMLKG